MIATTSTRRVDLSTWLFDAIARVMQSIAALRRAGEQTRADLGRAESARARERRRARDTVQARAIEARYARNAPGFAADVRAAIDRHEASAPRAR